MTPPPCPICGKGRACTPKFRLLKTCGYAACVSALMSQRATARHARRRVMPPPPTVPKAPRVRKPSRRVIDCGSWIGLAFYFDQPHAFNRPREDGVIQDTPSDAFSFSNC